MATKPLFDMSKAEPIAKPLFDMSKAVPVDGASASTVSAQPKWYSPAGLKSLAYEGADALSNSLPAAGATAGAMIGGGAGTGVAPGPGTVAGAVGGAGMGGMGGEAAKQILRNMLGFETPQNIGQQATDIAKQGATQGAVQGATEALPFLAPILKKFALGQYERALAPTKNINKAIAQKIAPEMIDRGIHGSIEGIENQAANQAANLGPQLDKAIADIPNDELAVVLKQYESPATPRGTSPDISLGLATQRSKQQAGSMASTVPERVFNPNPIVEKVGSQAGVIPDNVFSAKSGHGLETATNPGPLHGAMQKAYDSLNTLKGEYIVNGAPGNPQAIKAIEGVQDLLQQPEWQNLDGQSLRKLRQIFDDPVAKFGGFSGADLSTHYQLQASKAAGDSIRSILAEASPDVAKLNREMSFWLNVQKVTKESGLRRTGQEGGLFKTLLPLGAGGAGALGYGLGGTERGAEAAGLAVLTGLATQVIRTPAWRTASAVTKNAFADALASGNAGRVAALAARFGVAAATATPSNPSNGLPTQLQSQ